MAIAVIIVLVLIISVLMIINSAQQETIEDLVKVSEYQDDVIQMQEAGKLKYMKRD